MYNFGVNVMIVIMNAIVEFYVLVDGLLWFIVFPFLLLFIFILEVVLVSLIPVFLDMLLHVEIGEKLNLFRRTELMKFFYCMEARRMESFIS